MRMVFDWWRKVKVGGEARRYRAEAEVIQPQRESWKHALVKIFDGDIQIGQYERNHAGWAAETFEPFESDGSWYALYSRDYTSSRIMSLPDCKDLGGEESHSHGFCPVEFYVPRYRRVVSRDRADGVEREDWRFESQAIERVNEGIVDYGFDETYGPWQSLATGFVAGCIWGDDTSWKLEVIDLSDAKNGNLVRTARFGHFQLARGMSLCDALDFDRYMPYYELRATVIRQERRHVATGKLIDPYDE